MSVNEKFELVVLRRKLKAFLIASLATFSLLTVFWSMSVRGFISQTVVQLKVADTSEFSADNCQETIDNFWRQQISDYQLGRQIEELSKSMEVKHPVMLGRNFEGLRSALKVEMDPEAGRETINLKVSFTGEGSAEETQLVNQIADSLATKFSRAPVRDAGPNDSILAQRRNDLEVAQTENLERLTWLVEQIDSDLTQVRAQADSFGNVDAQEIVGLPELGEQNQSPFRTAGHRVSNSQMSLLQQKLNALREKLADVPSYAPAEELESIQKEIDNVTSQLGSASNQGAVQSVGFRSRSKSAAELLRDTVDGIDLTTLKSTISEMRETNNFQQETYDKLANRINESNASLPVVVHGVKPTGLIPLGDMNTQTMMMMLFTALIVGSVVAWGYQPLSEDRGFTNKDDLESKLKIPVVSQLVRRTDDSQEEEVPLCNLIVQLARYTLLALSIVVALSILGSESLRETFVADPLTGLSRIMWMLLGK